MDEEREQEFAQKYCPLGTNRLPGQNKQVPYFPELYGAGELIECSGASCLAWLRVPVLSFSFLSSLTSEVSWLQLTVAFKETQNTEELFKNQGFRKACGKCALKTAKCVFWKFLYLPPFLLSFLLPMTLLLL